jgi:hypothetical protein
MTDWGLPPTPSQAGKWSVLGVRYDVLVGERGAGLPLPGDPSALEELGEEVGLLLEELLVVAQVVPEQGERIDAGTPSEHDVGGRHREVVGVVFTDSEEVHADLVGQDTLFDDVPDRLGVGERAAVDVVGDIAERVEAKDERERRGLHGSECPRSPSPGGSVI